MHEISPRPYFSEKKYALTYIGPIYLKFPLMMFIIYVDKMLIDQVGGFTYVNEMLTVGGRGFIQCPR